MSVTTLNRPDEFVLDVDSDDGGTVVRLHGELDVRTAPQLRECFLEVLRSGTPRVEADLSDVSFIDAGGLGVLVAVLRRARHQGVELLLRDPTHSVLRVFEITGLIRVFPIMRYAEA
jgi:anti-anti-sigma factor